VLLLSALLAATRLSTLLAALPGLLLLLLLARLRVTALLLTRLRVLLLRILVRVARILIGHNFLR
jgi:hypothetical protein